METQIQREGLSRDRDLEEVRFQVIKAMLEEFPNLKRRVKEYLNSANK